MTDVGIDRIRYIGWFALWTAGMALSIPAIDISLLRVLIPGLFLIGSFIRPPPMPGEVPLYDKKLTWRDAVPYVVLLLTIALLVVINNAPPTRGVVVSFGDWIMRNWAFFAVAIWLLGSATIGREWYRREQALATTATR